MVWVRRLVRGNMSVVITPVASANAVYFSNTGNKCPLRQPCCLKLAIWDYPGAHGAVTASESWVFLHPKMPSLQFFWRVISD